MAKYSYEFKKEVVEAYLKGKGGYGYLAKKYGIPAQRRVEEWVANFKAFGDEGLRKSRKKGKYTFEKKLAVVELYLTSEISYQELALQEGILNSSQICQWVNDFRIAGPDALRPKKKGRKKSLEKPNTTQDNTSEESVTPVDTSAERVKQLEEALIILRIENAYLKELRRLRLEEEALLRKQRELSTVSEENSD